MRLSQSFVVMVLVTVAFSSLFLACSKTNPITPQTPNDAVDTGNEAIVTPQVEQSYKMRIYANLTGSTGPRTFNATIEVKGDRIIAGSEEYVIFSRSGSTTNRCTVNTDKMMWVDQSKKTCSISSVDIPLYASELQKKIDYGYWVSKDACEFGKICYEKIE